jgi:SAM-dependent methyltransferase
VTATWRWLEAEPIERDLLRDLAHALALPHEPVLPRNRLRDVRRLTVGDQVCYLKRFRGTQWRNRWRNRTTEPEAADDAEREAAVTALLRKAGVETPRPIAVGTDGSCSYYVCAAMPGRPLRDLLYAGHGDPFVLRAVAFFCGELLAKGFLLPDLSADHVFVRKEIAFFHFGVLDLHNGTVTAPKPAPRRLVQRVLRHFARSVHGLPVRRGDALRFAARLCRAAGAGAETRRILRALPPFDTALRYEAPGKSAAYAARSPRRTQRELELLARVWPGRPGDTVLDAPCGTGRLLPFLRERGARVVCADGAAAMLAAARAHDPALPVVRADALWLPFADRAVDGVVMFRFQHHLPPELARRAVAEACRVAKRFDALSFFHPCSAHHLQRRLRGLWSGSAPARFAVGRARLSRWAAANGFRPHAHAAELPFVKDLWVASFVRG